MARQPADLGHHLHQGLHILHYSALKLCSTSRHAGDEFFSSPSMQFNVNHILANKEKPFKRKSVGIVPPMRNVSPGF